ncbi:MAG: AI-2E family transporter [Ilumatobacteraceae bacterium]
MGVRVNFVPQIGGFVGGLPLLLFALVAGPRQLVLAGVLFVAYQFVENNLIQPSVIGSAIDLPAWVTLVAAVAGGAAGGVVGAIVLTPLVGVIKTIVNEIHRPDFGGHRPGHSLRSTCADRGVSCVARASLTADSLPCPSRGSAALSSTRSIPAASPTPMATVSATSVVSSRSSITWLRWGSTWSGSLRSTCRRRTTTATTSPTTTTSTRRSGRFGQFDELLAAAHARDIKIVMDLVVNHTSDEHPWFVESRSSLDNPKRDWYWWRAPRDGAEPNNWGSFFSGPAWQLDETTGEYYLHLFSKKQPDLNWENPDVRDAVYEMMRWWLDRGVDGFRMDVINFISKVTDLPDGRVHEGHRYGSIAPFVFNGPRIHEFLQEMHREVFAGREGAFLTVGEMPGASVELARLYTDPARAEVDMVFQFEHMGVDQGSTKWDVLPLDLARLKAVLGKWQDGLAEVGWNSLYWNNHDQPRVVSRFGDDGQFREASAKALGTVLHLLRGTPYVYQGEELGMTNMPFESITEYRDLEAVNHYAEAVGHGADPDEVLAGLAAMSRDHARVPMQWDDSPYAGFSTVEPWIRVNPNFVEINAAAQRDDEESVFALSPAHRVPALGTGRAGQPLSCSHPTTRPSSGAHLMVATPSCSWSPI